MKKKDKAKQNPAKEKEFSASPFRALKGALELPTPPKAAPAAPVKAKPAPAVRELDDETLFLSAMGDVRPLQAAQAAPVRAKVQAAKAQKEVDDQRAFLEALESLKLDVRFGDDLAEPAPAPVAVNRLRQVRRGGIRVDLQLDLHGLTRDEAIENLERFVRGAYNRRQKGVLVITGKGNNSPGEPVLKNAVAAWLRGVVGTLMVAEFVQAPSDMGGGGAFLVFLKEKPLEPAENGQSPSPS